jgi:hypothetical protein
MIERYKSISDELGVSKDALYKVWKEFMDRKNCGFSNKDNLKILKVLYKPELLDFFTIIGLLSITELMKGEKNGL